MEALTSTPLLGLILTAAAFALARWFQKKTGWVLANPTVVSAAMIIALLLLLDIPYDDYARGGDFVNLMLSPVTAILALGIYNQRDILKKNFIPVLVGCTVGCAVSMGSVLLLCRLFGPDQAVTAAMLPKSCTTAIAVGIAEAKGGVVAIAVACVIIAGTVGAVGAPAFIKWFHVTDPVAQGLAIGACSHALGTTKAREIGELQGAMSSISIGICGLLAVIFSLFLPL
ncbi:MAG TPA: LrgB family protein [Candidatus Avoscillospira stercorigallinarum]|uniref:LrgB family protein n=1 Tax=Candidatus Avoscillospira stercorigallinarum TaxID=2840708 RepID=A0A9D1CP37_9FIRM|nr:LrgB family protein [Candidatus Avoscillospira stercorigallinarum]